MNVCSIAFFMLLKEKHKITSLLMHPEFFWQKLTSLNARKEETIHQGKLSKTEERRLCP